MNLYENTPLSASNHMHEIIIRSSIEMIEIIEVIATFSGMRKKLTKSKQKKQRLWKVKSLQYCLQYCLQPDRVK